ncbi:MAG TPA: transglycosylase SLT domain-containing protein [Rhodocyclaceae bacterium]|nr:transglycosylase SLT domain-containing protein [Rhodocyclaceae bacterium]
MSYSQTACPQASSASRFRQAGFLVSLPRPQIVLLILLALLAIAMRPIHSSTVTDDLDGNSRGVAGSVRESDVPNPAPQLTPAMQAALEFSARRYRVSPDALTPIFLTAQEVAEESRLDPLLIIAVIATESSFNPFSQSTMGAQGLMQVIPRFHPEKLPENAGQLALFDPVINVRVGTQVLREYVRRHGGVAPGLQQFAGAGDDPEQSYANKVFAEKERLEAAIKRRNI